VREAPQAILAAQRPIVYAGGGVLNADACAALLRLVESAPLRAAVTLMGKGCLPDSHPLNYGPPGMHGSKYANWALNKSDLIIAVGVRFDDRVTGKVSAFAPGAKVIHFDIDAAEVGKIRDADIPVVGPLKLALSQLARDGDPEAYDFPTGRGEQFSFAGLKTALLYRTRDLDVADARVRADLAASYERAIVEALARRTERALERAGSGRLALGGGVAANGPLRARLAGLGVELYAPPTELCTDNAAMIASAARDGVSLPYPDYLGLDVYATGEGPLR